MQYAVYSEKQKKVTGSSIYLRSDGTEVEVTGIGDSPECPYYDGWDDKICLGEVIKWVRGRCTRVNGGSRSTLVWIDHAAQPNWGHL